MRKLGMLTVILCILPSVIHSINFSANGTITDYSGSLSYSLNIAPMTFSDLLGKDVMLILICFHSTYYIMNF